MPLSCSKAAKSSSTTARTVNPSDERSPTCKAWRSGSLNSRTSKGFIPQQMPHGLQSNNIH